MRVATEERNQEEVAQPANRGTRLGGTDIFRGALVIITAVVIGGFVISRGLDEPQDVGSETATETVDPSAGGVESTTSSTLIDTTVTTDSAVQPVPAPDDSTVDTTVQDVVPPAAEARVPAEVKVLVLNGAQTQGIAARGTEILKAASYNTAAPKNALTQQPSAVLYAEGYELDAIAVAATFSAGLESLVKPYDPAASPIDDTQEANVIVVIGPDDLIPIPG